MVVAIIEVVSKVERDIRGGDLDSNMSHPSFPMFWKCFHQEKYVQYGLNISTITILKISLWRICFCSKETDSSPSFYWHRDSDCELWGQIFPLKKGRKKRIESLWSLWVEVCAKTSETWVRSLFSVVIVSLFPRLKDPKILKVSKNHKIQYVSPKTKIFLLFWK